jgi:2-(1,2-epoxy-1,2-dihydrophenyl)acetyl-CoA isomerase
LPEECVQIGIANRVFPPNTLDERTRHWALEIAAGAPLALAWTKKLLRSVDRMELADVISAEALIQDKLIESRDHKEAVRAFFKKKRPAFKGL